MKAKCIGWILLLLCCASLADCDPSSFKDVANSAISTTDIATRDPSNHMHRRLMQSGDQVCNTESGTLWYTCLHLGCGVNVESDLYELVIAASCSFNEIRRMWDCGEIYVDPYTHDALVEGVCTQTCEPQKLGCEIFSRLETHNNVPIPSSECRDGEVALEFNCDCQILSRTEMLDYARSLDGSQGGCSAVCSELDRDLSNCDVDPANSQTDETKDGCDEMICLHENCAAQISRAAVDIVRTSTCTFSLVTRMWECGENLEIDSPGYNWARSGSCVDACTIVFRPDSCLFPARYGKHPDPPSQKKKKKRKKKSKRKQIKIAGKVNSSLIPKGRDDKPEENPEHESEGKVEKEEPLGTLETPQDPPSIDDVQIEEDEDQYEVFAAEYLSAYDGYYEDQYYDYVEVEQQSESAALRADPITEAEDPPIVSSEVSETVTNSSESYVQPSTTRIELDRDLEPSMPMTGGFETYVAPWMPCKQTCNHPTVGDNDQERFISCRSTSTGLPVARNLCPSIESTPAVQECPPEVAAGTCDGLFVYRYQDWSECTATEDTDFTCSRRRDLECYETLEDGSLFPTSEERCSSLIRDSREISCDWRQCRPVIYIPSEWSACDCDLSIERRNLTCISTVESDQEVELSTCESIGTPKPKTTRNCTCDDQQHRTRLLQQTTTECSERSCNGNGICRSGVCFCDPPFTGDACEASTDVSIIEDSACESSLRINGECCSSGLYDRSYRCCSRNATIDRDGSCCDGELDACGVCNGGAAFVDAYGTCCKTTLDANGFCCMSGNVDECGVCDGFGMSCDFQLTFRVSRPPQSSETVTNRCVENLTVRILPLKQSVQRPTVRHAVDGAELTVLISGSLIEFDRTIDAVSRSIVDALARTNLESIGCGVSYFELVSVDRRSVLGNGFCEIGETIFLPTSSFSGIFEPGIDWTGIEDCSFMIAACPTAAQSNSSISNPSHPCSGNGICSFAGTATCECYLGYGGEACDQCLPGYTLTNGRCLPIGPLPANVVDHIYGTVNELPEEDPEEEDDRVFMVLLSILSGVVLVVIVGVGIAVYLGWSNHNLAHNLMSSGTMQSQLDSRSRASMSDAESRELTLTAGSIRTMSSGAPIGTKTEPEEVNATPPKQVTEIVDGSDFHGNRMHRPILASTSSPALIQNVMTHCVVDISGQTRQARRMPSPDMTCGSPTLVPIDEGSPMNFGSMAWSPFGEGTSGHVRRNSRSLDSPGPNSEWLNTFDPWLNPTESEQEQPVMVSDSPPGRQDLLQFPSRSARSLRPRPYDSISSFEFDLPPSASSNEQHPNPAVERAHGPEEMTENRMNFAQRWRHFFRLRTDQTI